jgi:hypothetical protein
VVVRRALASLFYPFDIAGAHEVLSRLALEDRLFDRCDRLSGGQLQRVGIARVLYQRPPCCWPTSPCPRSTRRWPTRPCRPLVAQSEATGATLVASLHAVDLALRWFPRIVGMRNGQVMFDLPPRGHARDARHALCQRRRRGHARCRCTDALALQRSRPSGRTAVTPPGSPRTTRRRCHARPAGMRGRIGRLGRRAGHRLADAGAVRVQAVGAVRQRQPRR